MYAPDTFIESLPLFADLSSPEKQFIASKSQVVEFKKGEIIYKEGDSPDFFYCMINGRVEIYHPSEKTKNHKEFIIERVRRGDYFGSISSLTGRPHTVSTKVLNDSLLLRIAKKDFKGILQRIPKLAILLSHSLSRRLGRKDLKEIFESKIIAIYTPVEVFDSSRYISTLEKSLIKESGKKVFVLKSYCFPKKSDVSYKLSLLTRTYHYILVAVSGKLNEVNFEILKQADICHILSLSDKLSLQKTSHLIKKLKQSVTRYVKHTISVILKIDSFYHKLSYKEKTKTLSSEILASLPKDESLYKKTIRRIAREISGVTIGLALGSGAAMGLAHIGVLKILEEENIPIDVISGTSIGALIATFWAAGLSAQDIAKITYKFKSKFKTLLLVDPTLPIRGLIKGRAIKKILKAHLGNKTFFDVKLPLKIIACDIKNRKEHVIDKGKLVDAVMASIAIPGVFEPVECAGNIQFVDGGIVNPVPVNVLSRAGVKRIIAVNALPSPMDIVRISRKKLNIYDIIINSFQAMEFTIAENSCKQADVHIHPMPKLCDWYEFYKSSLCIKTGKVHTKRLLPEIKKLIKRNY